MWGVGRVAGHVELPSLWGGLVDVDEPTAATASVVAAHLVSGDPDTVHQAGISVRGRTVTEEGMEADDFEEHLADWPGEDPMATIAEPRRQTKRK